MLEKADNLTYLKTFKSRLITLYVSFMLAGDITFQLMKNRVQLNFEEIFFI